MKNLYLIGGTMGVGKTTVCRELQKQLDNCVFLDGDWCWDADPFRVTEETKEMVLQNICFLLDQFIHCPAYENILFCWVMHQQAIIDRIASDLDLTDCTCRSISLVCSEETLRVRLQKDIEEGKRRPDIADRSIARIPLYEGLHTIKIQTDGKSITQIAKEILLL